MWKKCILGFFFFFGKQHQIYYNKYIFNSLENIRCSVIVPLVVVLSLVGFWWRGLKAENARLSTAIQCLGPEEPLSHFFSGGKAAGN